MEQDAAYTQQQAAAVEQGIAQTAQTPAASDYAAELEQLAQLKAQGSSKPRRSRSWESVLGSRAAPPSCAAETRFGSSCSLIGATGLPLIVSIVGIGIETDAISDAVGASLVRAGMASVLVFPFLATRAAGGHGDQRNRGALDSDNPSEH